MQPFETRFPQTVDAEIRQAKQKILDDLSRGTILYQGYDAATIGLHCAVALAKVQGLDQALETMQSVHKEMTGPSPKRSKD